MELTQKEWKYGGMVLLAGISCLIITSGVMNVWVPMPVYIVIVAWITIVLFPILTPAIYLLVLKFASESERFSVIVLTLVLAVCLLNTMYFYNSWSYGLKYQGELHTRIVALENLVGFSFALILAAWAHFKKVRAGVYAANLLLFSLLSWCAFPYLGELP